MRLRRCQYHVRASGAERGASFIARNEGSQEGGGGGTRTVLVSNGGERRWECRWWEKELPLVGEGAGATGW
jgi:hypothetical protein